MKNDLTTYRAVRQDMRTGDMIQWRGNYAFSRIIRVGTGEFENHSSMIVRLDLYPGRVFSIEALANGLHLYPLSNLLEKYNGEQVNWYPIKNEYHGEASTDAARWLLAHLGVGYDWSDCLSNWRSILGFTPEPADARQLYCSESIFLGFKDRREDEESKIIIGAGLPQLKHITRVPVPGKPMLELGIWQNAFVPVVVEGG